MKYKKVEDAFYKNGKKVGPKSKRFLYDVCDYVISRIANGESLADIIPIDSRVFPSVSRILGYIDDHDVLSLAKSRAEKVRLEVIKESLISISKEYSRTQTKENLDKLVAFDKFYQSLLKGAEQDIHIVLKPSRRLPDDFWTAYENTYEETTEYRDEVLEEPKDVSESYY